MAAYRFRPFTTADLSMAVEWLRTPEVVRWWGDPPEQLALLTEDLGEPLMRQWIVEYADQPFAYAQSYEAHSWRQAHLAHLPKGTQVIDAFIGVPAMLGLGHGSGFLNALAKQLLAEGASGVAIDPDSTNLRARRAYVRAGFVETAIVDTVAGPVALMSFCP
jgi:aminoglycoside 6'-N-acetyltransferase